MVRDHPIAVRRVKRVGRCLACNEHTCVEVLTVITHKCMNKAVVVDPLNLVSKFDS